METLAKLQRAFIIVLVILGGIFMGSTIGLIWLKVTEGSEPMSCTDARVETMAMRACLAHRPQCLIQEGPAAFKIYHEALEVADRCLTEGIRQ